jgi:hypothetical protein
MIPNTQQREVADGGVTSAVAFGISQKNSGWIMRILRDSIYSDKLLAVLREYGANAWDAHRMVGKSDVPIQVTLPTDTDRILRIRDFGPGLSKSQVLELYTQYGESTKRCDNNAVGMLGIGCKSGFAYADSFTVTSWHAGMVRIFVASMDAKGDCFMKMLNEEACDEAMTGVEVSLAIRSDDVYDCTNKARGLYRYFTPQPVINTTLEPLPTPMFGGSGLTHGTLWQGHNSWTALMGCVPYPVATHQLSGVEGYDPRMLSQVAGALFFKVGDLEINASREGLAYDDKTKKALVNKINDLVEEFVKKAIKDIETSKASSWEKRIKGQMLRTMNLPVPDRCQALCEYYVHIRDAFKKPQEKPLTFDLINQSKAEASYIMVEPGTRILWRDDDRTIVGYQMSGYDLIVRPHTGRTLDEAKKEFAEICKALKIEGITTGDLSTLAWFPPPEKKKRQKNSKHTVRTFRLLPTARDYKPYSEHWETETEREPTKNDVFVLITNFKDVDPSVNFYNQYTADKALCDAFGYTMPEVYGYKTSEKKPVDPKKCKGTEYKVWRKKLVAEICAKVDVARQLTHYEWQRNACFGNGYYGNVARRDRKADLRCVELLGAKHPISRWVTRAIASDRFVNKLPRDRQLHLPTLYNRMNNLRGDDDVAADSECVKRMGEIEEVYPLFAINENESFSVIWTRHDEGERKRWADYVKLVDAAKKAGVQI